jgi:hypothetical protein
MLCEEAVIPGSTACYAAGSNWGKRLSRATAQDRSGWGSCEPIPAVVCGVKAQGTFGQGILSQGLLNQGTFGPRDFEPRVVLPREFGPYIFACCRSRELSDNE